MPKRTPRHSYVQEQAGHIAPNGHVVEGGFDLGSRSTPSLTPPPSPKRINVVASDFRGDQKQNVKILESLDTARPLDLSRAPKLAPNSARAQDDKDATLVAKTSSGPRPLLTNQPMRPSHAFDLSSDSELSDLDLKPVASSSKVVKKPQKQVDGSKKSKVDTAKVAAKKGAATAKGKKQEKADKTASGKSDGKAKGKVKTKPKDSKAGSKEKDKGKKPKAKPEKKPEVPVDPPIFEKVDTRLGRYEVEHRIMVSLSI